MPKKEKTERPESAGTPADKVDAHHTHVIADITGLQTILTCLQQQIDTLAPAPAGLIISAGTDQEITLPVNTTTLTATTVQGIAASWQWEQTSGPSRNSDTAKNMDADDATVIVSPLCPNTRVTGLTKGAYIFRVTGSTLTGETITDTVKIVVKEASPGSGVTGK